MTETETLVLPSTKPAAHGLRRLFTSRDALMTYILVALVLFAVLMIPRFAQPRTATFLLLDVVATLLMAMPMTLVMINGDIDLSVASVAGLSSAVLGVLYAGGTPFWLAVVTCLVIGLACGVFNGLMSAYVGLPALAVTIGTLALFRGLALVVIGDNAVANFPDAATAYVTSPLGGTGIPQIVIPVALIVIVFAVALHLTPYGRGLFALGNSIEAARFVGVNTKASRLYALAASGFIAALAGIFWTLRYSSARSDNATGLELTVIAAVVLGGVSVFGGRGSIWGSVCGVLIIGVINYALRLNRIPEVVLVTITGLLLIISVVAPSIAASWSSWRHRRRGSRGLTPGTTSADAVGV
ncbi:ABC transporter permease [Tessaracoccus sp. OS52]|uniref:ABC transporter permease n=1 Tax=Tessaracoccus sp. OS52 TaxID=2886691 RepID=UPI001D0FB4CF|nr:ABC transporter permease [Tessaracoccus sp. OS52]MCC2592562.1 ABC transporter permease [Tessaracoccus sp. OS52]